MAKDKAQGNKVKGYSVKVTGQYFIRSQEGKLKPKFYTVEEFLFPEIVSFSDGKEPVKKIINGMEKIVYRPKVSRANALKVCLHLITRHYIADRLREKYEDFVSVRLVEIFSKEEVQIDGDAILDVAKKPIQNMAKSELSQFVMMKDLNVVLNNYADLGDMKTAVENEIRQRASDDNRAGKTEAMSEEDELLLPPEESSLFN